MPRVNPRILRWARETAGFTVEEAVGKLRLGPARGLSAVERLQALESDIEAVPTRPMLLKMAKQYRRPLLTFYMSAPPRRGDRGQDFRTLPEGYSPANDALLEALIRDVRARQSLIREALHDEEEAVRLPFVGSVTMSGGASAVVSSIRNAIKIGFLEFHKRSSPQDAFELLRSRAEKVGVFVLLKGDLGSHHSAIDPETFRGFALADEIAPFVVINDQDSKAAWSFTLVHELAHIWLGETGVSGGLGELAIEQFCNQVAAEFLLPREELARISIGRATGMEAIGAQVLEFAAQRNLSGTMVAYGLLRVGAIDNKTWRKLRSYFREKWRQGQQQQRERARDQEGGPSFYVVRGHRVGQALLDLVGRMVIGGTLTASKAGKVLGVKATQVQALLGAGSGARTQRLA